jgi:hypothetical protein
MRAVRRAQAEAGLPKDKVVAAHGNFDSATCISTGQPVPIEEVREAIMGEDRDGWQRLRERYGGLVRIQHAPHRSHGSCARRHAAAAGGGNRLWRA